MRRAPCDAAAHRHLRADASLTAAADPRVFRDLEMSKDKTDNRRGRRGGHHPGLPGAAGARLCRRLRPQGRLRAADARARHRAGPQDRSGRRGRALPARRCPRRRRLEGAGRQRLRSGRQGRHPDRLPDGAVLSGGARHATGWRRSRKGWQQAQAAIRLSSDGRRHGSSARAHHRHHHRGRIGAAGRHGAPRYGAGRAIPSSSRARSAMRRSACSCAGTRASPQHGA